MKMIKFGFTTTTVKHFRKHKELCTSNNKGAYGNLRASCLEVRQKLNREIPCL